ncbi:MAG TPA: NAD(+) kinase, partial [Sphingobacterium sp.]|nr:NAD(+) kinase [Sphingobacterium sp.]
MWIYDSFYNFLKKQFDCTKNFSTYTSNADLPLDTDFMLSLGGDGTMLSAVSLIHNSGIP